MLSLCIGTDHDGDLYQPIVGVFLYRYFFLVATGTGSLAKSPLSTGSVELSRGQTSLGFKGMPEKNSKID